MAYTAAQNLSNFDEALKIDYLPIIRKQLENSTYLMSKLRRNERDVSGKQWQQVAHYGRNSGVGGGSETVLPTAGYQSYENPYGNVKYNRGRIQVTGPTMAASRNDTGAIVRALESEMKGVVRDLEKEINYQLHNDGTAVRALAAEDATGETTITVDTPGSMYLSDGMVIDFLNPSGGAVRTNGDSLTIATVDDADTITMSAAIAGGDDLADNDEITREDATDQAGTSYEMMGIKGIVDDATYVATLHNLSRSSYAWWKCSTHANDDNSGTNRDLTLDLIQDSITAVQKNGGKTSLILSDHDTRDAYASLVIQDKRFVDTLDLDGGFKALEYNGIPWVADVDCLPNTVYFLDLEDLEIMQMSSWDWMDKDGAVLSRVADRDAYEAVLFWYADLVSDRPRAHSFLRDVQ